MMHTPSGIMPPQLPRYVWGASWRTKLRFLAGKRLQYIDLAQRSPHWSAQHRWWWLQVEATERDMRRVLRGEWRYGR